MTTASWNRIFKAFIGPADLGRALNVTRQTAHDMMRRGSIPPAYWRRLIRACAARKVSGVNYDSLGRLAARSAERAAGP